MVYWIDLIVIIFSLILFFVVICILSRFMYEHFVLLDRRRHRVIPVDRLIRILQLRQQVEQYRREHYSHSDNYKNVMGELKNKIIIINPDEGITLGIEN
jgi:hypothetical protein